MASRTEFLTVPVAAHFRDLAVRTIRRFELPGLGALNIVLEGALRGGVNRSLALDAHGKTLGAQLLDLEICRSADASAPSRHWR